MSHNIPSSVTDSDQSYHCTPSRLLWGLNLRSVESLNEFSIVLRLKGVAVLVLKRCSTALASPSALFVVFTKQFRFSKNTSVRRVRHICTEMASTMHYAVLALRYNTVYLQLPTPKLVNV